MSRDTAKGRPLWSTTSGPVRDTIVSSPQSAHEKTTYVERVVYAVVNVLEVVLHEGDTLLEATLVETVQVCKVHLQPPETALAQRLRLAEHKQSTTQVIPYVGQVRRDRVCTTTEVDVVRHVDSISQELERHQPSSLR